VSSHSVVRGFSPSHISRSYRSSGSLIVAPSIITPDERNITRPPKSKSSKRMFELGADSSTEDGSSFEDQVSTSWHRQRSSLTDGLKRPLENKRTSFRDDVVTRTVYESPHDDEFGYTEDDEVISESAIEDDDSSDWDSVSESARSSVDDKQMFQRVDSRPHLTSRRSLLSTLLHEPQRAAALQNAASKSTSAIRSRTSTPSGPSLPASPSDDAPLTMKATDIPRSRPIIMTTTNTHPPALSPRTTRRNMLATELTESLRKNLLWERKQKNSTASAVLTRRHTSHDVANLQNFPSSKSKMPENTSKNNSWNHFFDQGLGEYHKSGW
jgi:hypothetical protein